MSVQENNRVLGRRGARELNEEEAKKIQGGFGTATAMTCTTANIFHPNGDGDGRDCI